MKTLTNMVVILLATTGTALAQSRGSSAVRHSPNGVRQIAPSCPNSSNRHNPSFHHVFVVQQGMLPGQDGPADSTGEVCIGLLARTNELQGQEVAGENQRPQVEKQAELQKAQAERRSAENQKRLAQIRERNAARPRAVQSVKAVVSSSGAVAWPKLLQGEQFADYRAQVSQVFQQRARTGQVSADDSRQIEQMTDRTLEDLKANIGNLRPQDYVVVKGFARSLLAELQSEPAADDPTRAGTLVAQAQPTAE